MYNCGPMLGYLLDRIQAIADNLIFLALLEIARRQRHRTADMLRRGREWVRYGDWSAFAIRARRASHAAFGVVGPAHPKATVALLAAFSLCAALLTSVPSAVPLAVVKGRVYVVGGPVESSASTIWTAEVAPDGSVGEWSVLSEIR